MKRTVKRYSEEREIEIDIEGVVEHLRKTHASSTKTDTLARKFTEDPRHANTSYPSAWQCNALEEACDEHPRIQRAPHHLPGDWSHYSEQEEAQDKAEREARAERAERKDRILQTLEENDAFEPVSANTLEIPNLAMVTVKLGFHVKSIRLSITPLMGQHRMDKHAIYGDITEDVDPEAIFDMAYKAKEYLKARESFLEKL